MSAQTATVYELGPLRLDPEARVLTHRGVPVGLGARAVTVLVVLVARAPEYVPKSAILETAWPGLVVAEANLAVQISAIRGALAQVPGGHRWIETLPRRGYRFIGPVKESSRPLGPAVSKDPARTNLPDLLNSFVGRGRELADIKDLLRKTRLLTLTGTGGIGKTRLAQHCATQMLDSYRDGVWFVDLAPLRDPALVPRALAQVLQVTDARDQTLDDVICDHVRAKQLLLVLDNCEHVLSACTRLTELLIREAPGLTLITTSREPLRAAGEHTYAVPALPLPDSNAEADSITASDAVQLFVERARQHRPRFDLEDDRARAVADICVRLDGIPLALELAAVRVAVLPVAEIARLLDHRFRLLTGGSREVARHQTLRATVDWSYELLDDAEKALFARLAVFAGGWNLAAAQAVCAGEPIAVEDVVYVLISLIERSLVVVDEDGDRYRLLETIREYAKEKLAASGEAPVFRQRHRDYFLAFAEEAEPNLMGVEQTVWLRRLDRDNDNLRAALEECLADSASQPGLRLCGALPTFWRTRGYLTEGRTWCERMLAKAGSDEPTHEHAKALNAAAVLAYFQGDYPATRALNEQSLAMRQALGDEKGIAGSLINLGNVAIEQGDYGAARALFEESLVIRRQLNDRWGIASSLNNLGNVALDQSEYSRARALYEECLQIARELGDKRSIAMALNNLGSVAVQEGNCRGARPLLEESLAIRRELGDQRGIAIALCNLGEATGGIGDLESARSLLNEALDILERLGDRRIAAMRMNNLGAVIYDQRDPTSARGQFAKSLEIMCDIGDKAGVAVALGGLAAAAAALGAPLRAARIWGAAAQLRERIGSSVSLKERPRYEQRVIAARADAGDDAAFEHAWQEGADMPLENSIELALQDFTGPKEQRVHSC